MAETEIPDAKTGEVFESASAHLQAVWGAADDLDDLGRAWSRDMRRSKWFWLGATAGGIIGIGVGAGLMLLQYVPRANLLGVLCLFVFFPAMAAYAAVVTVPLVFLWLRNPKNLRALGATSRHAVELARGTRLPNFFQRSRADGLNIPRPPVDMRGSLRRGWRLAGTFTDLVAGAGGIFIGGAVLLEGTPPTSEVGIFALVFLALGLWFAVKGIKKIRAWWLRLD